jgi:hypothetical protein
LRNPNPNCELDCRFKEGTSFTTCLGWERVYDKHGKIVTDDPNSTTGSIHCVACDRHWNYTSKAGSTKFEETT